MSGAEGLAFLIARLGWHREHPVTGKIVLINPDGPEAAAALTTAEARIQELEAALSKLVAEVSGLEAVEAGVRAVIGNTNWNVLMLRRDEARTLRGE